MPFSDSIRKLGKLRGRGLDELRVRGAQALASGAERFGLSAQARVPGDGELFKLLDDASHDGARPSAERLLERFRSRTSPRFFASFDDAGETLAALRERFGADYVRAVVARAERAREGSFDLLGLGGLSFGDSPDWHLEPTSGKRAPLLHWSRIDFLDREVTGDKKVTWELNRQQHFQLLGRAYRLTGDERFAATFAAHLSSWMDANPPKLGVNWASSLEVAFRSMSWLWALHFFRDSAALTPALHLRALKFLYLHARHLETYLSTYFSPNTHLTGEALGLYYLGTLLPEFRRAARWRETGRRVLLGELARHVRADGVYFEQASYYHRYTADFYTHLLVLARANGDESVGGIVKGKLSALLDHLMFVTRPDGTTPLFGDDDGGRLALLEEGRAADDFRATLSTGAALFARADYKHVAGSVSEETLWLLGAQGLKEFDALEARPPAETSRAFRDGGFYVMRDGWTPDANFMLLDCGPHGTHNCGHAHADALSFDLAARGKTLVVDPGTYTYTGSKDERDRFRSSAAHNTLTVDGESSSVARGSFHWRHVAVARARAWMTGPRFDFFEGEHDGFTRLPSPVTHARAVLFLKGDYWVVRDAAEGGGAHRYELHFHFAARAYVDDGGGASLVARAGVDDSDAFEIHAAVGPGDEWRGREDWVSRCYARRERARTLTLSREGRGPQEFYTFLVPRAEGEARVSVREVEASGGRAFELTKGDVRDLLLVRGAGPEVETAGAASDFAWTWARFNRGATPPEEVVVVGAGSKLSFGGAEFEPGGSPWLRFGGAARAAEVVVSD